MKASVIIPAYNAEKTIGKCLQALQAQSEQGFEAIVVDDGSNDRTREIVKGFREVGLLGQGHAGPAAARNLGARNAKGEIVVFLDSDCVARKNWLLEMLKPFQGQGIAGVQGKYENAQHELVAKFTHFEIEQKHEKMAREKYIDFMGSYSAAYRKSLFQQMGGFDASFPMASGEDTDLSFRIHGRGHKLVFNPKAIVQHFHPVSLGKYLKVKFFRAFWRTKIYSRHKGKMVKDSYTGQAVKAQVLLFYLMAISLVSVGLGFPGLEFAAAFFVLLLLSALPFVLWAAKRDLAVAVIAPVMVVARTAAFAAGLLLGMVNQLRG